jgi:LacI family transcriptional regulator
VDALALVGEAHDPELIELLAQRAVPFVNTFVYRRESHGTCIGPDNYMALHKLASYLADLGHRHFGLIAQSTTNNDRAQARLKGVQDALAMRSIAIPPQHLVTGLSGIGEGRALFRRIIEHEPWPTAIMCGNAYLAIGAMLESQAQGIRVPNDMSIVGYDDIELMRELPVPITTVRVAGDEVGRRTARFLISRLETTDIDISFECDAQIIIRASSGPPRRRHKSTAKKLSQQ